jgi:hypothetical protein
MQEKKLFSFVFGNINWGDARGPRHKTGSTGSRAFPWLEET